MLLTGLHSLVGLDKMCEIFWMGIISPERGNLVDWAQGYHMSCTVVMGYVFQPRSSQYIYGCGSLTFGHGHTVGLGRL